MPLCWVTKEFVQDQEWCDSFGSGVIKDKNHSGCMYRSQCHIYPKLSTKKSKICKLGDIYV